MKECDNSTRKILISSNFILSISLLISDWRQQATQKSRVTTQPVYTESYPGKHGTLRPPFYRNLKFCLNYFLGLPLVLGC
jgi:hypothetical protein